MNVRHYIYYLYSFNFLHADDVSDVVGLDRHAQSDPDELIKSNKFDAEEVYGEVEESVKRSPIDTELS